MIPPRKLKISPQRGSWTGNGALEAVDGVQGRLTAPWRRQRPATHVACPVAGLAGLYNRTSAENQGWHGIISPHGLDGRGISAAEAFMNVKEVEWTHRGVWNDHKATQNATDDETGQAGVKRRCIESKT